MAADPRPVAAIVTEYRQNSHADLIVGRILEGYNFDGKTKPELKLVSLFTDQVPQNDWSRALAKKHDILICDTIEGALTRGTDRLAVDGVLMVAEHGNYPTNEKGQRLYPRRRFFEAVATTFGKCGSVVPVFNDKHLAPAWADAHWMYDRSRQLMIPFLAGSSLPLTWRQPQLYLPLDCRMTDALAVGYGEIESSGFHALEMLQCMVERRRGGEAGVERVQCLEGRAVWKAVRRNERTSKLLDAALASCSGIKSGMPEDNCGDDAVAFLLDYRNDLRATVLMLTGHVQQFSFAARLRSGALSHRIVACQFYLQPQRPFAHFTYLVRAIESMVLTGHSPYPVERTLLTTGILDALMTSRYRDHRFVHTPELNICYEPVDYPFATDPIPTV